MCIFSEAFQKLNVMSHLQFSLLSSGMLLIGLVGGFLLVVWVPPPPLFFPVLGLVLKSMVVGSYNNFAQNQFLNSIQCQ